MKLKEYNSIAVLTGAGISAESGIKTFRDHGGLWENHRIEDVASPEGFARDPEMVLNFYNMRRKQLLSPEIVPNLAHQALAEFEKSYSGKFTLITQNVDNLHERAGSQNILHMHGELLKIRCEGCLDVFETTEEIILTSKCQKCQQVGRLRPHIVWFGEIPFHMNQIQADLQKCEAFVSIGTSAQVYPAAMFVEIVKMGGGASFECNLETTQASNSFDENLIGKASETVPKLFLT